MWSIWCWSNIEEVHCLMTTSDPDAVRHIPVSLWIPISLGGKCGRTGLEKCTMKPWNFDFILQSQRNQKKNTLIFKKSPSQYGSKCTGIVHLKWHGFPFKPMDLNGFPSVTATVYIRLCSRCPLRRQCLRFCNSDCLCSLDGRG